MTATGSGRARYHGSPKRCTEPRLTIDQAEYTKPAPAATGRPAASAVIEMPAVIPTDGSEGGAPEGALAAKTGDAVTVGVDVKPADTITGSVGLPVEDSDWLAL